MIGGALHQTRLGSRTRSATSRRRCEFDEFGEPTTITASTFGAIGLDGFLPVGRRVADVVLVRADDVGKAPRSAATIADVSSTDSVVCVTPRRGCAGWAARGATTSHGLDEKDDAVGQLPHGADDFGMALVADEDDRAAAPMMKLGLAMHFRHQRAGRVDGEEIAAPSPPRARTSARHGRKR